MANQNFNTFNQTAATDQAFDVGLRAHMVRVYNYMASGLALSGIVAYGLMAVPGLSQVFFQMGMTRGGAIVPVGPNLLGWSPSWRRSACCFSSASARRR